MSIRDGQWELYDYNFQTGRSVWHYFDGQEHHFRIDQPVDDIVRMNEFTRNATAGNAMGDWVKIASIPISHAYQQNIMQAHNEGDDKYVARWLNDSDNRAWRSFEGRV